MCPLFQLLWCGGSCGNLTLISFFNVFSVWRLDFSNRVGVFFFGRVGPLWWRMLSLCCVRPREDVKKKLHLRHCLHWNEDDITMCLWEITYCVWLLGLKCTLSVGSDVSVCVRVFVCMYVCVYWHFLPLKDCVVFLYANVLVDGGRGDREHSYFAGLLFWEETQRCGRQVVIAECSIFGLM